MKMKKGLLTMLALLSMGSVFAQDYSVPDARVAASRMSALHVTLGTEAIYRDLQFDLTLPEGIALADEKGGVVKDAASKHTVAFNALGETDGKQTVRFVVYNDGQDDNVAEKFGSGILVDIPIVAASSYEGTKEASLSGVFTSNDVAESLPVTVSPFNIKAVLLGDVNDNGLVEIADAVAVVNNVTGKENEVFVKEAADVNGNAVSYDDDAKIGEIADAVAVVNIVVGKTDFNSAKATILDASDSFEDTLDPQ